MATSNTEQDSDLKKQKIAASATAWELLVANKRVVIDGLANPKNPSKLYTDLLKGEFIIQAKLDDICRLKHDCTKAAKIFSSVLGVIRHKPEKLSSFLEILKKNDLPCGDLVSEPRGKENGAVGSGSPNHEASKQDDQRTNKPAPKFHTAQNARSKQPLPIPKDNNPHKFWSREHQLQLPASNEQMKSPLSRENYKEKFQSLLYYENKAHIDILQEKCNGKYHIVLGKDGGPKPAWMKEHWSDSRNKRFGHLKMNGDRISYAVQATRHFGAVSIQHNRRVVCSANILPENYYHTADELYIAFNDYNAKKLNSFLYVSDDDCCFHAEVRFELKHSYFRNLSDSVNLISDEMIARIVPIPQSVTTPELSIDVSAFKDLCSEDQQKALEVIASCPPYGPPVVIAGPFGTGKSYLLAVAAQYFVHESKNHTRVLVCTQQHVSASSFTATYKKMSTGGTETVCIIQNYGYQDRSMKEAYWTVDKFQQFILRRSSTTQGDIIVITTCLTARNLAEFVPRGYFTHILIDEGAQMREPEAIAPLSMADPLHTKIVVAGDDQQVGPALLVLGDLPSKHGLSESLLARLHKQYKSLGKKARSHYATLVTNYRSRSEILNLTGELFYKTELKLSDDQEPPAHPHFPYPLAFVCSSVDNAVEEVLENTNKREAEIVVDTLEKIVTNWPSKLWGQYAMASTLCAMSMSRAQLTVINENANKKRKIQLNRVRRHATYDMQGREFRALVLSTAEPTNKDASTKNPLKSFSDRYVFNTAITRTQSLVVAVGNPFLLLKTEKHMVKDYREKGKCWSNYLKRCILNGAISVDPSLKLSETQIADFMTKLKQNVQELLPAAAHSFRDNTVATTSSDPSKADQPIIVQQQLRHQHQPLEEEFEFIKTVGQGGFGIVYQVRSKIDKQEYALKMIKLPLLEHEQEKVMKEAEVLAKLSHENILRYNYSRKAVAPKDWKTRELWKRLGSVNSLSYGSTQSTVNVIPSADSDSGGVTFQDSSTAAKIGSTDLTSALTNDSPPTCLCIFTEYCEEGTLKRWLLKTAKSETPRLKADVMMIFHQILQALRYMHVKTESKLDVFIHKDINPSNIFFSGKVVKVGDLGLVSGSGGRNSYSFGGTIMYMSPEQLDDEEYDEKVDMYALGLILFELLYPMKGSSEKRENFKRLKQGSFPTDYFNQLPNEATQVIDMLLEEDPGERFGASKLCDSKEYKMFRKKMARIKKGKNLPTVCS